MQCTVYRQASKMRDNGRIIYKGEDARPYVGKNVLLVADGLGGASAIRHLQFKRELFDKSKLVSVLFEGIPTYSQQILQSCPAFSQYVVESFEEFTSIKDYYTDNIHNIKKSGYFASRIVSAIFLHQVLFEEYLSEEARWGIESGKIFDDYNASESKEAFLRSLSVFFTRKIQTELKKIASNANLIYEVAYLGLALLGTTLCATIFREKEDCVEALYFVAGDSRPYVWKESGLHQIVEDQEREDGGMTNYIKANEDATFTIECKYAKFEKPCILFNATDGCFDSTQFVSQMAFEKLLLEKIVESQSIEEVGDALEKVFLDYGKHDDSSTMALRAFGYENYETLRTMAQARLDEIQTEYIDQMSDVLELDYTAKLETLCNDCPLELKNLRSELIEYPSVFEYCTDKVAEENGDDYRYEKERIVAQIEDKKYLLQKMDSQIWRAIRNNLIIFEKGFKLFYKTKEWKRVSLLKQRYQEQIQRYNDAVEEYKAFASESNYVLLSALDFLSQKGDCADLTFENLSLQEVFEAREKVCDIFTFFKSLKNNKNEIIAMARNAKKQFYKYNSNCARFGKKQMQIIFDKIVCENSSFENIGLFVEDAITLRQTLEKRRQLWEEIDGLERVELVKVAKQFVPKYWTENNEKLMREFIHNQVLQLPSELMNRIKNYLEIYQSEISVCRNKAERQREILERYDKNYYALMQGV